MVVQTGARQRHFNVAFIVPVFLIGLSPTRYAVGPSFAKLTIPFIYKMSRSITVSLCAFHLFECALWRHSRLHTKLDGYLRAVFSSDVVLLSNVLF